MSNLDKAINKCREWAYGEWDVEGYHLEGFCRDEYEELANWLEVLNNLDEQISALYEDCENGAEDDIVLGWNRAIDKVREVIKAGGVDG